MESHVVVFECNKNTIILFFRLLRQGVIEAKTRGSRKQRKEKKNRTKKVLFLISMRFDNLSHSICSRCAVLPRPRLARLERR